MIAAQKDDAGDDDDDGEDVGKIGGQAYQSWLGFYNSLLKRLKWTKVRHGTVASECFRMLRLCCSSFLAFVLSNCSLARLLAIITFRNGVRCACLASRAQEQLVENANWTGRNVLGLQKQPVLQKKTVGKMGLKGVKGLLVV